MRENILLMNPVMPDGAGTGLLSSRAAMAPILQEDNPALVVGDAYGYGMGRFGDDP